MAVILNSHKPNFSKLTLRLLSNLYYMKVEEVVAIGIEAFRHDQAETFFKNTLKVALCERDSDPEYIKDTKESINDFWKELYPWLLATYRIYPPLKFLVVHHIDYKDDHLRIYAYADIP